LEYPRESEKQKRFLEREKKTTTARSLFSLEEHKPATRGTAHLLLFYAQTLSLSLFKDDDFCEMTPTKRSKRIKK